MYEKKLRRLLQPCGRDEQVNGKEENAALYSDSEDDMEGENKCSFFSWLVTQLCGVVYCSVTSAGSEADKEETVEQPEQSHQEKSQVRALANECHR